VSFRLEPSIFFDTSLKIRFFEKACPEELRDRIFFESDTSLKIRFFEKACPEELRDRIFFESNTGLKIRFFSTLKKTCV
jgi:hypothetical protein